MSDYFLGTSDHEYSRLQLQQEVWEGPTNQFLGAVRVEGGWNVLDLGCGPGLVTEVLRERVGRTGSVLAVDESRRWIDYLEKKSTSRGWTNVRAVCDRIERLEPGDGAYDLVFLRWVLGFMPDRQALVARMSRWLKPGGVLAVMDYNHEGVSLFPASPGFQAAIRATRESYTKRGGDTWVMGDIHRLFLSARLRPTILQPFVLAGGPDSPAFRWADAFFPYHLGRMKSEGLVTAEEEERFFAEWEERKADPAALFYSPIVVGAAAQKTGR